MLTKSSCASATATRIQPPPSAAGSLPASTATDLESWLLRQRLLHRHHIASPSQSVRCMRLCVQCRTLRQHRSCDAAVRLESPASQKSRPRCVARAPRREPRVHGGAGRGGVRAGPATASAREITSQRAARASVTVVRSVGCAAMLTRMMERLVVLDEAWVRSWPASRGWVRRGRGGRQRCVVGARCAWRRCVRTRTRPAIGVGLRQRCCVAVARSARPGRLGVQRGGARSKRACGVARSCSCALTRADAGWGDDVGRTGRLRREGR